MFHNVIKEKCGGKLDYRNGENWSKQVTETNKEIVISPKQTESKPRKSIL